MIITFYSKPSKGFVYHVANPTGQFSWLAYMDQARHAITWSWWVKFDIKTRTAWNEIIFFLVKFQSVCCYYSSKYKQWNVYLDFVWRAYKGLQTCETILICMTLETYWNDPIHGHYSGMKHKGSEWRSNSSQDLLTKKCRYISLK
jgi:hypothetical protein